MIIFDVLTDDSPVGWKGERTRLFLTEAGYQKSWRTRKRAISRFSAMRRCARGICTTTALNSCADGGCDMRLYYLRRLVVPP